MSLHLRRIVMKSMNGLAAGVFGLLACGTVQGQGVVFVDDYEATSPAVDNGPALPALRNRMASPSGNGMNRVGSPDVRGQAPPQVQALPREMLAESTATDGENEPRSGLFSKLKGFSIPSVFSDNAPAETTPAEQSTRFNAERRRQRSTMWSPEVQEQTEVERAKPSRFSWRRLFGDDAAAQTPPPRRPVPAAIPNSNATQNPQTPDQQQSEVTRAWQQQLQREQSQTRDLRDTAVAPAGYSQRNSGLQLRPTGNRPASLFGDNSNNLPQGNWPTSGRSNQDRTGLAQVPQNPNNNAFNRGPETLKRLTENGQTSTAGGPQSQPIFVSDQSPLPTATQFGASPVKRPLITSVSQEMRSQDTQRPLAMPQSRVTVSQPTPLVIENRAARSSAPQGMFAKNPVPPQTTVQNISPAAAPSPRAVELLTEANAFAQSAKTEEQLTQVVQMCRHVLAIDSSPQAVRYSKNLAAWALNRRGELRADVDRDSDAMLDFEDALHTDPNLWRAVHNRGVMLAQQGQFAAAFDDFNRTVELNPKFAKAYSNRGALYVQAGDLAAALDDYRQAISLDPDLAVAHKGRGRVCHMLGNFEEALQHYDAAVLLASGDAHMALGRADLLVDMGRYAAATEGYQQAIALDPTLEGAYRSLAWVQATCPEVSFRNAEHALFNAEQALRHAGQEDDLTLDTLAAAQANAGDFTAAQATQTRVLELASGADRPVYQERLELYQANQPFRTAPPQPIRQATYRP